MTKKQKKDLVSKLLKKWQKKLNLQSWDINVCIVHHDNAEEPSTLGDCTTSVQYMSAVIRMYPKCFIEKSLIEKVFVHEMCHVLTAPLHKVACDLYEGKLRSPEDIETVHEQLTETISRLV